MASNDESSHQVRSCCYFKQWMELQAEDLNELQNALTHNSENAYTTLIQKCIDHFKDYMSKRSTMFHQDASSFFAPTWCSSLESSSLWIAGCRPSSFIRLIYSMVSSDVESIIADMIQGRSREGLGDLSAKQLNLIDSLHMKTVKDEDRMSTKVASLQEDIADQPISVIAKGLNPDELGQPNEEVERALDRHESSMANLIDAADKLRLYTLKELVMKIFTPAQAVDFLVASKKLHLSIHEWAKTRDDKMGRTNNN
ncbi:hypothetical protein Dsin_020926 [Dipteronia sinensis]|uniref:DOG1 domain-containing protein n=1 Tax=Dipteronia sinensis TaxID=43782 RepID=A0AAE0AA80_9ROSI|nr:hypothetical protein Dsin_020926 [Dipteronia sinensis]